MNEKLQKNHIKQVIKDTYRSRGWKQLDLAAHSNLPVRTVQSLLSEKGNPTVDTLLKVCVALDLEIAIQPTTGK
jgi:DNA-binding phage protein